jgi:glycosyltransferase involved in cell wall biosynthesis
VARILVIADGQGVHGARWVDALCELGHVVHWAATRTPTSPTAASAVTVLQGVGNTPVRGAAQLLQNGVAVRRICARFQPDVVQAQFLLPCGWYAWFAQCRPYTIQLWGSDILKHDAQPPHYRWLSARSLAHAASVTADSRNLIDVAQRVAPRMRPGPVLSWGVDTDAFKPVDDATRTALKRALGIQTDDVLLCTRNFGRDMNVTVLVEAFAGMAADRPCTLVLKKGFPLDVDTAPVRRACEGLGITDRVRIIEEEYDYRRMAALYAVADVFVSIPTPGKDGLAQSLLDALASGCVPVVSRNRDTLEVVGDGQVRGVVVDDPHDAGAVGAACLAALSMQRRDATAAIANRTYIQRRYERRVCIERIDESIRDVLSC